jgi:hypothetical protein
MTLIEKIEEARTQMQHLALNWAKISPRRYARRFKGIETWTSRQLHDRWKAIKDLRDQHFVPLAIIYAEHTDEHWRNMQAMGFTDLPEYRELAKRIKEFRAAFFEMEPTFSKTTHGE